jgi:hypothetical protein
MSVLKLIVFAFEFFVLKGKDNISNDGHQSFEEIKNDLRFELTRIIYKFLIGLVIVSIIVFSFFNLEIYYLVYMEKKLDGQMFWAILTLTFLIISAALSLIFLFYQKNKKIKQSLEAEIPMEEVILLQKVFMKFSQGIVEGYLKNK